MKEAQIFDAVEQMKKVTLPNDVIYKEHVPQRFLRGAKPNPQFQETLIWTVSAGSAQHEKEEVIKFCFNRAGRFIYGPYQKIQGLCLNDADGTDFLDMAHQPMR